MSEVVLSRGGSAPSWIKVGLLVAGVADALSPIAGCICSMYRGRLCSLETMASGKPP